MYSELETAKVSLTEKDEKISSLQSVLEARDIEVQKLKARIQAGNETLASQEEELVKLDSELKTELRQKKEAAQYMANQGQK